MQVFGDAIRFGVQATTTRWSYSDYLRNWLTCERFGFDIAYATDHLAIDTPDGAPVSVLEGPTLLAALAAQTSSMRCGMMVASNLFRNPGVLAKIAATLDQISNGRLELGMGAGHLQAEHDQFDIPFFSQGRRLRMLGESIQVVRSLLTNERTSFDGKYYRFHGAACEPKPVQGRLPILIGGVGGSLTLRTVAQSADIWNDYTTRDLETYLTRLEVLKRHCQDIGRDPDEIRKSLHIKPLIGETEAEIAERSADQPRARSGGTPEQIVAELLPFAKAGVRDFVFMLDYPGDIRSLELLATRVAPIVRSEAGARVRPAPSSRGGSPDGS